MDLRNRRQRQLYDAHRPGHSQPNSSTGYPIPIAMLELGDGNLLIADSNPGNDSANHHQILEYDPATQNLSQFANLTVPVGTSQYEDPGLLPQPSSLLLDADGNLLVGLAPSQAGDGRSKGSAFRPTL